MMNDSTDKTRQHVEKSKAERELDAAISAYGLAVFSPLGQQSPAACAHNLYKAEACGWRGVVVREPDGSLRIVDVAKGAAI